MKDKLQCERYVHVCYECRGGRGDDTDGNDNEDNGDDDDQKDILLNDELETDRVCYLFCIFLTFSCFCFFEIVILRLDYNILCVLQKGSMSDSNEHQQPTNEQTQKAPDFAKMPNGRSEPSLEFVYDADAVNAVYVLNGEPFVEYKNGQQFTMKVPFQFIMDRVLETLDRKKKEFEGHLNKRKGFVKGCGDNLLELLFADSRTPQWGNFVDVCFTSYFCFILFYFYLFFNKITKERSKGVLSQRDGIPHHIPMQTE